MNGGHTIAASYLGYAVSEAISVEPDPGIALNETNAVVFWLSKTSALQSAFSLNASNNCKRVKKGD